MTNTTAEAIAWMKNEVQNGAPIWRGYCLKDVRMSLGIDSLYPDAATAWREAKHKHRVSGGSQCPRGVAVFWTNGDGYGHVVLSAGGGYCFSNDIKRSGHIDFTRIDYITERWGQNFEGWTEDLNGVHYYDGTKDASPWASGKVYVAKLQQGTSDSDSVRRLQYRLLHHKDVPAKDVRLTGNYGQGTRQAVQHWQRNVWKGDGDGAEGKRLTNRQANALFGDKYSVIEE